MVATLALKILSVTTWIGTFSPLFIAAMVATRLRHPVVLILSPSPGNDYRLRYPLSPLFIAAMVATSGLCGLDVQLQSGISFSPLFIAAMVATYDTPWRVSFE